MTEYDETLYLSAGTITTTHGLKGEVKVFPSVDDPGRFSLFKEVFLKGKGRTVPAEIENVKFFKKMVILKFKGIDDINDVIPFRNMEVMAKRSDIADLKENQYFDVDLIGLRVFNKDGEELGILDSILHSPANDVFVIKNEQGREILIPSVKQFVLSVDIEKKEMICDPLPGMLP